MAERPAKPSRFGYVFWLLVLVCLVVAYLFYRPSQELSLPVYAPATLQNPDVDHDDVLVDLVDDLTDSEVEALAAEWGVTLRAVSDQSLDERLYRASVAPGTVFSVSARLAKHPSVEIAEPDSFATAGPFAPVGGFANEPDHKDYPNDPKYKYQWHLDQIHMPAAWPLSDGKGVIVAVLDTGVAYENFQSFHLVEDLAGVEFVKGFDFVANDEHANDDHGHGTHVAGTIAQATHNGIGVAGVARRVQIMPLKVLSGSGSGSVGGIADAIRYAADEGAHVINMSLGSRFPSKVMQRAVEYAHKKGVIVVCAAGNDGRGKVGYPAAYPDAFAVAATQYDESTTFYSNWGKEIAIAAPGGNTRVDQNGDGQPDGVLQNTISIGDPTKSDYFAYMGTSMASPHAAAVAALVVAEGVSDPKAVAKILRDTARRPKGQDYKKDHYGAGIIDADSAVKRVRGTFGAWQLLLGTLIAFGTVFSLRRRSALGVSVGLRYAAGVLLGSSGLFFLPLLGVGLESWGGLEVLTRGLPSWGLALFGPEGGNLFVLSALIPAFALFVGAGLPGLRTLLAGLLCGVSGHLLFHSAAGVVDVSWMPADSLWLFANGALCAALAHLALKR